MTAPGRAIPTISLTDELIAAHERIESKAEADWFHAASPAIVASTGLAVETIGSVGILLMAKVDVLMFNRAVGIGLREPATEALVDRIVARYRAAGVSRFLVPVSPAARPGTIPDWIEARGFRRHNAWVKLHRDAEPVPPVETAGLRLEEIGPERGLAFGRVVQAGFSMMDLAAEWIALTVGRRGWRHYLALDGAAPVGAAAMYLDGDWGWFGFAATLEEARGRGAQSALIARRVADAHAAGCRWLSIETAEDTPDRDAPSFRNVTRQGFRVAYVRPNWLWKAPGAV
jgi:GNAT superfamily N-acetyltransferase